MLQTILEMVFLSFTFSLGSFFAMGAYSILDDCTIDGKLDTKSLILGLVFLFISSFFFIITFVAIANTIVIALR